jgi:hypothetical protein
MGRWSCSAEICVEALDIDRCRRVRSQPVCARITESCARWLRSPRARIVVSALSFRLGHRPQAKSAGVRAVVAEIPGAQAASARTTRPSRRAGPRPGSLVERLDHVIRLGDVCRPGRRRSRRRPMLTTRARPLPGAKPRSSPLSPIFRRETQPAPLASSTERRVLPSSPRIRSRYSFMSRFYPISST